MGKVNFYLAKRSSDWHSRCDQCGRDIYVGDEYWNSPEYLAMLCSDKCVKEYFDLSKDYVKLEDN